jgi:ribonuclease Z
MKAHFQFLSTPTADTPGTAILLHFPERRYIFGQVAEGTQRACTEVGARLLQTRDIFLTGTTKWENIGGLVGVMLTMAESLTNAATAAKEKEAKRDAQHLKIENNKKKQPGPSANKSVKNESTVVLSKDDQSGLKNNATISVHGGRNLAHTLATARRFVFRKGIPLVIDEYDPYDTSKLDESHDGDPFETPSFSDDYVKVWALPILPNQALENGAQRKPSSPRKRSHDEFEQGDDSTFLTDDQELRRSIVHSMFNSTWQLDRLIETPLAEAPTDAALFVRDPKTKDIIRYSGPRPVDGKPVTDLPNISVLMRTPWPAAMIDKLPPTSPAKEALSYVVRNYDTRGKFDVKKAQTFNVKKGPDYARLTRGESVISLDGKTITSDMVLGPAQSGRGTAIADLPTVDYIENFVSRPEWNSPAVTAGLGVFLWLLGPGVVTNPRLLEFVDRMAHCTHVVSSVDCCPNYLAMRSAAGTLIRLAQVTANMAVLPKYNNDRTLPVVMEQKALLPAKRGLLIDLAPTFQLNRDQVIPFFNPTEYLKLPRSVKQRVAAIRHRVTEERFGKNLEAFRQGVECPDAEIITLGTGSSTPSKYRNVSATLLKVPGTGYYLLDAGENTMGQLKRVYSPNELKEVLQNLRMIWISHLHADHHLGTTSVIRAWYEENYPNRNDSAPAHEQTEIEMTKILQEKRLFVVSEENMTSWLEEYASSENYGFDKIVALSASPVTDANNHFKTTFTYRHCHSDGSYPDMRRARSQPATTQLRFDDPTSSLSQLLRSATGLSDMLTVRVPHCRNAMAVSLVFPNGLKVSYSGDCRPSRKFVEIGRDSTVLIHEATFQDEMQGSARAKKHSTISEALEVGRSMGAKSMVLTHFSQRYQKVAPISQPERGRSALQGNFERPSGEHQSEHQADPAPDVPDDDDPSLIGRDEIKLSPGGATKQDKYAGPVAYAFDCMRIRVGDIPIAEAYFPAVEKLLDILERSNTPEEAQKRVERKNSLEVLEVKKKASRKHTRGGTALARSPTGSHDNHARTTSIEGNQRSAWSASESESGWSDLSEGEGKQPTSASA